MGGLSVKKKEEMPIRMTACSREKAGGYACVKTQKYAGKGWARPCVFHRAYS